MHLDFLQRTMQSRLGSHPAISTEENISNIKRQINEIAAIYDWDMEVNTTDPEVLQMDPVDLCEDVQKGPGL